MVMNGFFIVWLNSHIKHAPLRMLTIRHIRTRPYTPKTTDVIDGVPPVSPDTPAIGPELG